MRIIWIEDSPRLQHTLALYCEKHGAKVKYVRSQVEFCNDGIADVTDEDLILLDILFDNEGERDTVGRGYEVLRCLKQTSQDQIPVVILSVLPESEVRLATSAYPNVRAIVRKPVTARDLEKALNTAWEWRSPNADGAR